MCETVNLPNGLGRAVICIRGGRRCWECPSGSKFQCDFPIGKYKSGKKKGRTRTCDRHLCGSHARHGVTEGIDFCSEHFPIARAAYERRLLDRNNPQLKGQEAAR